ncbi:DUF4242 domain-containing protein [Allomuricauda sp. SCSIO 65647]|uniref:DUF4242 domain-containing protein n=1 Tax=Allomuricauda sp. SCSIO 65647 TaxID=2908843 RepID=UPI001F1AF0A1|nr:DUF4242 domain-containing protein [Muricauda sp. SCSIO 65647]UJH68361.1 DUF4242 domain-containing protein [Muricauda sp. SCSIO 65647]
MKKCNVLMAALLGCLFFHGAVNAQEQEVIYTKMAKAKNEKTTMKTYLIEREIPNAGQLTAEELKGISQKSCSVLKEMGAGIEWLHSYVTDDKVYCVYKAESQDLIREHAEKGGFPVNSVQEMSTKISPATANE